MSTLVELAYMYKQANFKGIQEGENLAKRNDEYYITSQKVRQLDWE